MDKISIIIPIYNSEPFLEMCLESVINQTYNNIEIICINDGSTDDSLNICNNYAKIDKRIIVISKENSGVSDTRNVGLETATGKYISFVDSDDFIANDMIEVLHNMLVNYKADVSRVDFKITRKQYIRNYKIKKIKTYNDEQVEMFFLNKQVESACVSLYESALLKNIRFKVDTNSEDLLFNHEVFVKSNRLVYSPTIKYFYFNNMESRSRGMYTKENFGIINVRTYLYNYYSEQEDRVKSKISKELLLRAYAASLIRIAVYGIDENLDETKIANDFRSFIIKHLKTFMFSVRIPLSRKFVTIPLLISYEFFKKFMRRN